METIYVAIVLYVMLVHIAPKQILDTSDTKRRVNEYLRRNKT